MPSATQTILDEPVREQPDHATPGFDSEKISADIPALAEKHGGNADAFRSGMAQLLKAELGRARDVAQAELLKDRHGRRCAENLCTVHDEIIRILFDAAFTHLYHSH